MEGIDFVMTDEQTHDHTHEHDHGSLEERVYAAPERYRDHMRDFLAEKFSKTVLIPELLNMGWGGASGGIATYVLDMMNVSPGYEAIGANAADLVGHTLIYSWGLYRGMKNDFYRNGSFRIGAFALFLGGALAGHEAVDAVIYAGRTAISYEVLTTSDNSFYMWASSVVAGVVAHMGLMTGVVGTLSYFKERYEKSGAKVPPILRGLLDKLDHDHTHGHSHDDEHYTGSGTLT